MAKTNIGRVSIVLAGEYSSLIEYKRLTAVSYQGSMYISRTKCLGIEPTNESYWFKAADKGGKGDTGQTGPAGKDFSIYKTYPSISAMQADVNNVPEGSFVMIASNVEDEDNSKLYVKSETNFVYITDLSGATGIQGPQGEKGDKPVKGVDYFTQQDIDSMVSEITDDANSVFNQNVTSKTEEFNTNATEKTSDFNDNYTEKLNNINNAQTTAISNINNASTTAVSNVESAEDTAISNIEAAEESSISDINTAKNGAIEEINSQDNVGRIDDLETISAKNKKNIDLLLNNFENAEAEGTKIDLENTAEAPIEIEKIEGNTTQNGEPSLENEVEVAGVTGDTETLINNGLQSSEANYKSQLQEFSLGDKVLYGDENARDYFNITIDSDFYQKTGYRKITNLDLVKKWKKYILDGINNKFNKKSATLNNNIFITNTILDILIPENNNSIVKSYCNYFKGNFSANNIYSNNIIGLAISIDYTLQFGFGLNSEINTFELANAKLQELNTEGHPLYVIYQLKTPETENITDETLIAQIENFINNSYTYKQATSINSDFYLKLNYRKNMYYDLETRVKALEQANTPSSTPSNTPE